MRTSIKLALLIATAVLVVGGPEACSHNTHQDNPPSGGSPRRSAGARYSLLPHPAFAQQASKSAHPVSIADIAEQTTPSVVNISSLKIIHQRQSPYLSDPLFRRFFEDFFRHRRVPRERRQRSLGSGVIVSADGIVLTNNHVVDKADEIKVHLHDGRDLRAKVIGTDPKSDVAVLRLEGSPDNLHPIGFGNSDRLRLGDIVLAIGNPFGVGQTVTMGIVSATGRANVGIVDYEDFIQTDAAINPGNSGGALVDMEGKLVGINTAILSRTGGYQGIGFAIPSNMAKAIERSIVEHGKVVRGWLGVAIQELTPDLAKALKLAGKRGVLISDVQQDSPAQKAGLKRGDLILSVNATPTRTTGKLRNLVAAAGAGAKVQLAVLRDGKELSIAATLGELPASPGGGTKLGRDEGVLGGLTVGSLDRAARKKYGVPQRLRHGVVVREVAPNSPAGRSGIREGDVLIEINRKPIDSVKAFRRAYRAAKGRVLLLVYRKGGTLYLLLEK